MGLTYTSMFLFITEGSWESNANRGKGADIYLGHEWVLLADLLLMTCSICFLVEPRTTLLGVAPSTVAGAFPFQSLIKKMPYRRISQGHFLK